jgi:hypothetical protein
MNWNYQTDIFQNDQSPEAFSSVEALRDATPDLSKFSSDSIMGLGNKKKKAEKKLAKAEKALAHGNTAKAQKKIDKAAKKIGKEEKRDTTETQQRLLADQQAVTSGLNAKNDTLSKVETAKKLDTPMPIDPSTLQDSPNISGSGLSMPLGSGGSGGGGDMLEQQGTGEPSADGTTPQPDGNTMDNVTITNRKYNPLLIGAVIFAIIGIILFLTRKK